MGPQCTFLVTAMVGWLVGSGIIAKRGLRQHKNSIRNYTVQLNRDTWNDLHVLQIAERVSCDVPPTDSAVAERIYESEYHIDKHLTGGPTTRLNVFL